MKTNWKKIGFAAAVIMVMAANLAGIRALATEEGDNTKATDPPPGVLAGYKPVVMELSTGGHLEHYGSMSMVFTRYVEETKTILCCTWTGRQMDGCKDLPICPAAS